MSVRTDQAQDAVIAEAIEFAAACPAERDDELARHFWDEIVKATGANPELLMERVRRKRSEQGNGKDHRHKDAADTRTEHAARETTPTGGHWEPPVPLGGDYPVPPLPLDCFPGWLARWIEAEARATQTPADLPALTSLAACGAALARRFRVRIRVGYSEPVNIYVVTALPPGDRKSAVFADAMRPVQAFEAEEQERMTLIIASAASDRRMLEQRVKNAESHAAKASAPGEHAQLAGEARELARQLAGCTVPEPPQLYCDDVTPEKLANLIADQGGRMLQASAEGTAFEIAKGRYSETANFDVYLKAHAGDPLRVNRVSRKQDIVAQPALSAALTVQPDVIRGLAENATMRGRGFLARWLYSMPVSLVGHRQIAAAAVPEPVGQEYHANVMAMWRLQGAVDGAGKPTPRWLNFSGGADHLMRDFERWLEPQLGRNGDLHYLAGWANKLAGAIARIAAILHVAEAAGNAKEPAGTIEAVTVSAAIWLGRDYLLPHAQAAFGVMGADERLEDARRAIEWIINSVDSVESVAGGGLSQRSRRDRETTDSVESVDSVAGGGLCIVSQRDIHVLALGGHCTVDHAAEVAELLEKHGYLRPVQDSPRSGPGRRPSPRFAVNPLALKTRTPATQSTQSTEFERQPGEEG